MRCDVVRVVRSSSRGPRRMGAPVNLKTAALRLGVHYQTAYRWVRSGQLVAVKVGAGYEISDAAVERLQAQRAATGAHARDGPSGAVRPPAIARRADALHVLDLMVDARHPRLRPRSPSARRGSLAEHLGDTAFVYRLRAGRRDRCRRVRRAPRSGGGGRGVDARARSAHRRRTWCSAACADDRRGCICVPQVPQRELRRRLHPELHEHLQLVGLLQRGERADRRHGAARSVLVTRDLPGRPYTSDDVDVHRGDRVAHRVPRSPQAERAARGRGRCGAAPRATGRAVRTRRPSTAAASIRSTDEVGATREPVVAVLDLELRHVACSKAYADAGRRGRRRGSPACSLRSLVRDGGALDDALAPVLRRRDRLPQRRARGARRDERPRRAPRRDGPPRRTRRRGASCSSRTRCPRLSRRLIRSARVRAGTRTDWGHATELDDIRGAGRDRRHRRDRVHEGLGPHRARDRRRGGRAGHRRRRACTPADIDGITWSGAFPDFDVDAFHEHFGTSHEMWTSPWGGGMAWAATAPYLAAQAIARRARRATCSTCSRSRGRHSARR